ncbi:MAG: HD domain-containing phosphohydrolase, partial [Syntrophomonas sp.]
SEIEEACFAIRQSVDKYNRGNSVFTLSVSVGFSYHGDYDADIASLLKDADNQMYRQKLHRKQLVQINLVQNLTKTLVDRDIITEERINKLQDLYILFALECGISQDNLADLRLLVRFHDIGKIGISEQVLFPRGPLTTEQRKEKQRHCEIGYRIARSSDELIPIADWILKHHEWWNGEGYPLGLKRGDIPLECRILAIVVAYDAMISDRPHRQAKSSESAIEEIKCCAGIQFDPVLVEKFINIIGKYGFKI